MVKKIIMKVLNPLTVEQKLEIRRLYRKKEKNRRELAEMFDKSEVTISQVLNDNSLDNLETRVVEKENKVLVERLVNRMIETRVKILDKIDQLLPHERDLRKITPLLTEFNKIIQILQNRPTEIKEQRKLSINLNEIINLPPEKRADYLLYEGEGNIQQNSE